MDIGVKGGELKTSFGAAERRVGADGQEEPSGHSAATKYLFQAVMPTAGRSPNLQFGLTNFICRIDLEGGSNTSLFYSHTHSKADLFTCPLISGNLFLMFWCSCQESLDNVENMVSIFV